jgi:hypothetical protein
MTILDILNMFFAITVIFIIRFIYKYINDIHYKQSLTLKEEIKLFFITQISAIIANLIIKIITNIFTG